MPAWLYMLCSAYNFACPSDHCTQLHAMTTGEAGTCTTASAWLVPLQLCSVRLHASEIHTPLQVALLTSNSISIFVETLREFPSPPLSVLVLLVCGKASKVTRGTFAVSSFFPFPSLPFPSLPFLSCSCAAADQDAGEAAAGGCQVPA